MGQPVSDEAYPNVREFLNIAISRENGAEAQFSTHALAFKFRNNCYTVRARARQRSEKVYKDPDHPSFGKTPWDELSFEITEEHSVIARKGVPDFAILDPVTKEPIL